MARLSEGLFFLPSSPLSSVPSFPSLSSLSPPPCVVFTYDCAGSHTQAHPDVGCLSLSAFLSWGRVSLNKRFFCLSPAFYVDAGDLNSGPHAYTRSSLCTGPSPQSHTKITLDDIFCFFVCKLYVIRIWCFCIGGLGRRGTSYPQRWNPGPCIMSKRQYTIELCPSNINRIAHQGSARWLRSEEAAKPEDLSPIRNSQGGRRNLPLATVLWPPHMCTFTYT